MTINEITNSLELNIAESHTMRRLDEAVTRSGAATVGTQYGDVTVITRGGKCFASCVSKGLTVEGTNGSGAFLKLADKLRGLN